ncbi:hypothetical protein N7493_010564 [Penicillium malachiteum]|uniref:Major facilitator superfamily (MFS) profile domain-containing protein n=1 Tax=Penicillium malachiteum TaxID=1324776 RepID=A0AAD6HD59_9EURO|nr:hypothetical protein N7493_010564 [Penicillium malachiteum]
MMAEIEKNEASMPVAASAPNSVDESEPAVVTLKTWVVALILSCGYDLSFWPVPVVSAIGSSLSADMGDTGGYIWFVPTWTISTTCSFLLFGPNTDLFGRRWFLVLGNLVTFAGHIIVATAKNSNQIIAGLVVTGFSGANCQIAVIVAPVTARFGYEMNHWVWNFWGPAIFQVLSFVGLLLLYHPPKHPLGFSYMEAFKSMDYLGAFLFIGGVVPFLLGIVWANVYSSTDPHVVASLVAGAVVLVCFALWETFGNLKYPLAPTAIFTSSYGRDFTAPVIALGVINMFYYSSSILWPEMIDAFYTNFDADWRYAVVLSLPQGFGILLGALLLTFLGSYIRNWQWQLTGFVFVMVLFGSLLGLVLPHNKGMMIAFLFLSQVGFGWGIYLSIALCQMGVTQQNLGVSGGISGCLRFAAGAVATTIYEVVFDKSLTKYMDKYIPDAVTSAGLSESKVTGLMSVVSGGASALTSYSPAVASAAVKALEHAYCKAIFIVAMVSMAFGIVGLIACLCCKDVDAKMTNRIEVYLENTKQGERNTFH